MESRKRQRLSDFDYTSPGAYFITVCVEDMRCTLGNVLDGRAVLHETGEIVKQQWDWLFLQYPYLVKDEYVVMPNHFHGIIHIGGNGRDRSLQDSKIKSLSELIGAFKTTSSKKIHLLGQRNFQWQKSFYDRVVRNEDELHLIREYIVNNPLKWTLDSNDPYLNGNDLFVGNGRDRSLRERIIHGAG